LMQLPPPLVNSEELLTGYRKPLFPRRGLHLVCVTADVKRTVDGVIDTRFRWRIGIRLCVVEIRPTAQQCPIPVSINVTPNRQLPIRNEWPIGHRVQCLPNGDKFALG